MAVMDEFKEEREALKNGTPKQKLAYFWYYYKWHVIIALVVIIMIVSFVKQLTDRKDPAFYAVMLNASLLDQITSEQPDFVTDFAEKEGIDLNTSDITFDTSIRIVEDSMDETSITSSQKPIFTGYYLQDRKDEDLVYMFAYVNGFLEDTTVDNAVIDVNGFGINVRISADTASRLPGIGEEVRLYTYTYVKEDAFLLYGFLSRSDLEMFKLCITVSGIGPKGALAILSVMDADDLRFAIMSGDAKAISRAPGVGARTAQRLILELKDKISIDDTLISREIAAGEAQGILTAGSLHIDSEKKKEAVEALVALGYGQVESLKAVNALEDVETMHSGAILKAALKKLF